VAKIEKDGVLYAIVHRKDDWEQGLNFYTPDDTFIQVGTFWYQKGKQCAPHRHLHNDRPNKYTQECNIVMTGSMMAKIYDNDGAWICDELLTAGDMIVVLNGGHGYTMLEYNTRVIECKNGPFISVEKDKVPI